MSQDCIRIEGARQNNLKGFDLELPLNELIVVTGVSGSGKSSLAFDTVYAEGQRRYVETFSAYARQFLDRTDKPRVERISGIPPAIAIDQTNPVRTSRSTVGTMTELNDHLKLLFARAARLFCGGCGREVSRDSPESICTAVLDGNQGASAPRALVIFTVVPPASLGEEAVRGFLHQQGYTRVERAADGSLEVVQDRLRISEANRSRLIEALEAALRHGQGRVLLRVLEAQGPVQLEHRFSSDLHCAYCDLHYREPLPGLFSFNSPVGACDACRGFGRVMGIDYGLVVPDESLTLGAGAIKPWQTQSYRECQGDLVRFARQRGVPLDVPWRDLDPQHREWVIEGEGPWEDGSWYGARRFFDWLETKSYKMHIRVLLSRYRAYTSCPACRGARLKPEALLWRVGELRDADRVVRPGARFQPADLRIPEQRLRQLPGLCLHEIMLLSIGLCRDFFADVHLPAPLDEATGLLLGEIRARLRYLADVGLGYLTLDRQSRTLSGGEVQRINLTTALGTSLVSTLFVLDEPSIGLHARDMNRVVRVLRRLRDAGNSLLVVEHDPQVMLAADRIVDLGPGPGTAGGEVVFFGTPADLMAADRSLTGRYLSGRQGVASTVEASAATRDAPQPSDPHLEILGASQHNLRAVDVRIPLGRLVCVTGVSGSGKSTLVHDVCYLALRKLHGRPVETPGAHQQVHGYDLVRDVVLVDQTPIGKTTRSNPASYVGALEPIRKLFAVLPLARERGYTAGTFSFNSGTGRCPTCGGNGFEHVEMQFLSDVYLRCPDCDGRRFRPEVLEVEISLGVDASTQSGMSIADVLDLTVDQAAEVCKDSPDVARRLEPLRLVGLGYLTLGQPVPTLSGGEAQRLKLAGYLGKAGSVGSEGGTLLLFDEPTTGLHFDDVAKLLAAFQELLRRGHSLVVIEHNLDVVRVADWVIDMGPEGGAEGGDIVCVGTPAQIIECTDSHTGKALRDYRRALSGRDVSPPAYGPAQDGERFGRAHSARAIEIRNAREHNLKGVDITIPANRFTVITGVSGSGKSTVAFDILFAEGQRRYLESLNAYARQFVQPASRPDVDAIFGIPPTVAIEQRSSRGGRKSTVATLTEVYHFLRLLFVKLGTQYCPDCDMPIEPQIPSAILNRLMRERSGSVVMVCAPLVVARKGYYTDLAKWAAGKGYYISSQTAF